ncbi:DUF6085 family protein [Streptomyces microflavus]|uniref:DUF6085 family protein n=1 Tax=Streptomyces microflavus TaxID=1919 RepID=UPI00369A48D4
MPDVQGRCLACGGSSLFLGEGGHVTCARIGCPDPTSVDDLLHGRADEQPHVHAALQAVIDLARQIPRIVSEASQPDRYALAPPPADGSVVASDG